MYVVVMREKIIVPQQIQPIKKNKCVMMSYLNARFMSFKPGKKNLNCFILLNYCNIMFI